MSPYDENWNLDMIAIEAQLNHPQTISLVGVQDTILADECGGCGAKLTTEHVDDVGRAVKDFACGYRYVIGQRTVSIQRQCDQR